MSARVIHSALVIAVAVLCSMVAPTAQDRANSASQADPRIGLKDGVRDAGQAIRNMELVASLPKPAGFFDPQMPLGRPTPAERQPAQTGGNPSPGANNGGTSSGASGQTAAAGGTTPQRPAFNPRVANRPDYSNSDLAFSGHHLFLGNFHGFNVYDVEDASDPRLVASVVCPGGQGDVSVYGNLLFMSVEQVRGRLDCGTQGLQEAVSGERFRGVRIFDITDVARPRQVAAVQTCRGSHTHTLVPDPRDPQHVYVYGSGTSTVRSAEELAGCSGRDPKEDPETSLYSIDVIDVPLAAPSQARIVNRPRIFTDASSGSIAGLWAGGTHGDGTQRTSATNQCHDITVFPSLGLAAGACSGNGLLLDISDPVHPVRLDQVLDKNFAYWHSATFNNDGTKVIFTDEWGGGTRPRCRASDPPTWGANAIFEIVDRKLRFASYYKLPAVQTDQENCVAHNGSIVPVPGRDIMVQGWYQGGVSVFDFTDAAHPVEIAFFDRGPLDAKQLYLGGYWSAYWFDGRIFASEIARGLDVFRLTPSEHLSQNEITAAVLARTETFNAQEQLPVSWPASAVVGRAYVDQLTRSRAMAPARATAVRSALERADAVAARAAGSADASRQLDTVAGEVERDAAAAQSPVDARRFRDLAALLKSRAGALR